MNTSQDRLFKFIKTKSNEIKRVYENWLGNNKFFCAGKIYAGYINHN